MKRKLVYVLLTMIVGSLIFVMCYPFQKEINKSLQGVLYQLGTENVSAVEQVKIEVYGKLQKKIFGNKTFYGKIKIDGEVFPPLEANEEVLEIIFWDRDPWGGGTIEYMVQTDDNSVCPNRFVFGTICIGENFNKLTIAKHKQRETGSNWNSSDGFMISAPATNRTEAVNISNELINSPKLKLE